MKLFIVSALFILIIFSSCRTVPHTVEQEEKNLPSVSESITSSSPTPSSFSSTKTQYSMEEQIEEMISSMSLQEKVGQLFLLAYREKEAGIVLTEYDADFNKYLQTFMPGGLILFSVNTVTPNQTRKLIADIQGNAGIPLFIAVDEEGGKVSRLGSNPVMKVAHLPPAAIISSELSTSQAEKAYYMLALELKDLGINVDMAPVADVSRDTIHDVIGNRSFSRNPETAGQYVEAAVKGLRKGGICSVLKHFPGHGSVSGDTHNGRAVSKGTLAEFESVDFIPFIRGIGAGADFIMTAHISAPALTGNMTPSSLSPTVQTDILRTQLGYKGLIITDSLQMGAIQNNYNPGEAAVKALSAGADMLLIPADTAAAAKAVEEAVKKGVISENRLDRSLRLILSLKYRIGMFEPNYTGIEQLQPELKEKIKKDLLLLTKINGDGASEK